RPLRDSATPPIHPLSLHNALPIFSIAPAATGMAVLLIGGGAVVLLFLVQPRIKKLGAISHATSKETLGAMQQALHGVRDIKLLGDRKSTRLNSSHVKISYAVFCLK